VNLIRAASLFVLLFASTVNATYVYEANQNLIDLKTNYIATSYNLGAGDDQVSSVFNLDFTFTFYGQDFTSARMATNGCLHFGSTGGYCNDYTPDPLPEITYTLYPFWTDLIRDNGSKVLARNFTDKSVFGWYNLREYNRGNTDNSFEVILWKSDDSFEFRYGGLDIINHDVLIGEQGTSGQTYTYLFHDQCGKGTTNAAGTCVNTTWNASSFNTLLENGGSLYGVGSGNGLDCSNPLNNTACSGYDAAYLTQQCDLDGLYSTQCPNYWDDLFDYECSYDSQHSPACPGYMVETFEQDTYYEESMYGYDDHEEDMYGYEDSYYEEDYGYEEELIYTAEFQGLEHYYEEEVYYEEDLYLEETIYFEEEYFDLFEEEYFEPHEEYFEPFVEEFLEEEYIPLSYIEEETYIEQIYEEILLVDEYYETDYDLPILEDFLLDHFEHEEHLEEFIEEEPTEFLEFETIEELEEWIESEESEELLEELADANEEEVRELEDAEAIEEESQDREENLEIAVAENEDKKNNKRAEQLNVVANTIRAASNSVSGTTSGTSTHATGTSAAAGGVSVSSQGSGVSSSVSGGTVSIDSSPSISAQVASSAAQTQQILTEVMSPTTTGNVGIGNVTADTTSGALASNETSVDSTSGAPGSNEVSVDSSSTVVAGNNTTTNDVMNTTVQSSGVSVQTQSVESQIETAVADVGTTTDTDQLVAQIVANNVKVQQEEMEEQQAETGEYADSTALIGFMAYVPGFTAYRQVDIPDQTMWYQPKEIYSNISITDNNAAFLGMYSANLQGINSLKQMQPNL
jgi:hypothetical protein